MPQALSKQENSGLTDVKIVETPKVDMEAFKGLMIALPCYGGNIRMETVAALSELRSALAWQKVPSRQYHHDMCNITTVRNCIITKFYDDLPEYDHLLMVDNDMSFTAKLVVDMIGLKRPLVGTAYHRRQTSPNIWDMLVGEPFQEPQEIVNGFQQWKYIGAGIMLIKRHVITQMPEKLHDLRDNYDPRALGAIGITRVLRFFDEMKTPEGRQLSEDYSFCERWRQCGGDIWANVERNVGHVGTFSFGFHHYPGGNAADLLHLRPEKKDPPLAAA